MSTSIPSYNDRMNASHPLWDGKTESEVVAAGATAVFKTTPLIAGELGVKGPHVIIANNDQPPTGVGPFLPVIVIPATGAGTGVTLYGGDRISMALSPDAAFTVMNTSPGPCSVIWLN